jgi:glutaminase
MMSGEVPLAAQEFCDGFNGSELALFESLLERRAFDKGACLCREGDPADSLIFVLSGQVSVNLPLGYRKVGRLSTISSGAAIGEMAMLDGGRRSADIVADTPVVCLVLDYKRLEAEVSEVGIQVRLKLVTNIARALTKKLRMATLEIKTLRS